MAKRTILYHRANAPNGQEFDLEQHSAASLAAQGYVDNPAKFGHDIWQTQGSAERVMTTKQMFETGHLNAIEDENAPPTPQQAEVQARMQAQLEDTLRQLEFYKSIAQPLTPAQEAKMMAEREADLKSDAAKLHPQVRGPGDEESEASKQMREQDAEAQLEMERQEQEAAKEQADLAAQAGAPAGDPTAL